MQTRTTHSSLPTIQAWWTEINNQLGLFLSVLASGQSIPDSDVDVAMQYIMTRLPQIQAMTPPAQMVEVHQELVSSLENMKQSLLYRQQDNTLIAQARYDIARVNIDSVRFHLLRYGIMI
ncbi:MAG: hypothetical protein AAF846_15700 [Chloroflexota bacterium]